MDGTRSYHQSWKKIYIWESIQNVYLCSHHYRNIWKEYQRKKRMWNRSILIASTWIFQMFQNSDTTSWNRNICINFFISFYFSNQFYFQIIFISIFVSIFISISKYLNSSKLRKKNWKYQNQANWSKYFNSTNPPQLSYSMDPEKFFAINNH